MKEQFKGYFGKVNGKTVWVSNKGMKAVKRTGELVHALKVHERLPKSHAGAGFNYSAPKWIRAEMVS